MPWFHNAVVYQIYPRSFADSNADGIGDLAGVTSRVDYLKSLGIDAVWLSPFYPSQLADGGYDVDDYTDVDPRLGTLEDFDAMVAALHAVDIKVVVDIVPNHTSDQHEWFRAALSSEPGSPERDRYIFREGTDGQPPNDWQSGFGGPIWEHVGGDQWYHHYFAKEQPDLNWDNPEVRAFFLHVLRFWLDRGVDGFRVDVAHGLIKDWDAYDRPWSDVGFLTADDHPFWDVQRAQTPTSVLEVYADWRAVLDSYDPPRFAVAEAGVKGHRRSAYAAALGQSFNFQLQDADWTIDSFRDAVVAGLADRESSGSTTWLLGSHDTPRVATRFGLPDQTDTQGGARSWLMTGGTSPLVDAQLGQRRARAAALALMALPGSLYIFQGDELGLQEVGDLPDDVLQDPIAFRNRDVEKGRDGTRVPIPWTSEPPSFGFGDAPAHLPQPDWFAAHAVAVEDAEPSSTLNLYRAGLAARKGIDPAAEVEWQDAPEGVLRFRRGKLECVICFTGTIEVDPYALIVSSEALDGTTLGPDQTAWLAVGD